MKLTTSITSLVCIAALSLTSCQSKKDVAQKFAEKCIADIDANGRAKVDAKLRTIMEQSCHCAGESLAEKFSAKEVEVITDKLLNADKPGKLTPKEEQDLMNKIGKVLTPCFNKVQEEIKAQGLSREFEQIDTPSTSK